MVPEGQAKEMYCAVTMQRDNRFDSCFGLLGGVTLASSSLPGHCKNILEAVIMANNAHQPGDNVRALESLSEQVGGGVVRMEWSSCKWRGT